jgi:hypothetical protein
MFDTFLAVIMLCALNAAPGTPIEKKCVFMQDRLGPSASRVTCQKRLDKLWVRMMNNPEFIARTHKQIGDFRLIQNKHRGFCVDPQFPLDQEIQKYYEP